MSSFTTPLVVTPLPDGKYWKLAASFSFYTHITPPNDILKQLDDREDVSLQFRLTYIHVPKGFKTNFASSPRPLWWLVPPMGKYGKAAVIHDYMYAKKIGTREWADKVFYEAMDTLGVPGWKRWLMYKAVRWFGDSHWGMTS